ncbi:MAG TPA: zf-HC2 domain-containing protein [Pyrinomonadaceae bacterium]|jgi:anti-sigma factor RsiW|nr:zf-HC2 domain-containing protein [Pyrinomonadaceae bacterium]
MDCEFTEKVSLLLDAELEPGEALRVKEHIVVCPACQQAQSDFLRLRREIKAYDFQPRPFAQAGMLARILNSEKLPLWRRSVSMPVPLMTLLLAIIVGLGVWSLALRRASRLAQSKGATEKAKPVKVLPSQAEVVEGSGSDFSRYDHGERAAIYKVRRTGLAATVPADSRQ